MYLIPFVLASTVAPIVIGIVGGVLHIVWLPIGVSVITVLWGCMIFIPKSGIDKRNVILLLPPIWFTWIAFMLTKLLMW